MSQSTAPPEPSRFPRVQRSAIRAVQGLVNGVDWWRREPTDVVDRTPFEIVHRDDKLCVRRYLPLAQDDAWALGTTVVHVGARRQAVPVLLIPPLMVPPFIFDLTRQRSLVRTLLKAGFDVFLCDFGEPDRGDKRVSLDRYVLDWVPQAVDAVLRANGGERVSLYGYCMGGLFALLHVAVHADPRVHALVTIGSPIDAHKMGLLSHLARLGHRPIEALTRRLGNVPGPLSSAAFRMTSPVKSLTRYGHLVRNLWNDDYVAGFDGISAWTDNFLDYPGTAFRQLLADFLMDNKLMEGRMAFGEQVADLRRIQCPLLAFAGAADRVVPPAAAHAILATVASQDKSFVVVPGGHMGVFAGRGAPLAVWDVSAQWLAERGMPIAP